MSTHRFKAIATAVATMIGSGAIAVVTSATATAMTGHVTLTMQIVSDESLSMQPIVNSFEKANPTISLDVKYIGGGNTFNTLLATELSNGTAPEIFSTLPGSATQISVVPLGKSNYLENLATQPWANEVPNDYKSAIGVGKAVYSPAIAIESVASIYNATALASHHLTIPRTFAQVLQFCSSAKSDGVAAYALGAGTDYENQMPIFLLEGTLVQRNDPAWMTQRGQNKVSFTKSGWLTAFTEEQEMLKDGCFAEDALGTTVNAAQTELAQGKALGYFGLSFQLPDIQALAKTASFTITTLPATNNSSDTRLPIAIGAGLSMNAKISPALLPAAEQFFDYLMSPKQLALWSELTDETPAFPDPLYKANPSTASQVQEIKDNTTTLVPDQFFPNQIIRQDWITGNEKMLAGEETPLQIVQAMDGAW